MTEKEAIAFIRNAMKLSQDALAELMLVMPKIFKQRAEVLGEYYGNLENCKKEIQSCEVAIAALEEIQQYREIGTVEECREAVEKLKTAKEAIRKLLCNEYGSVCQFCEQDNNTDAMCRKVGGSGSWCCENAKWNGRTE